MKLLFEISFEEIEKVAYAALGLILLLAFIMAVIYRRGSDVVNDKPVIKGDDFGGYWNITDKDFNRN